MLGSAGLEALNISKANVRYRWKADIDDCRCRMAHVQRMSISPGSIAALIDAVAACPAVATKGLRFAPVEQARFHQIAPHTVTWDWCGRHSGERGLQAALAYYDADGLIVSVNVAHADQVVTEVELWRGDGQPIQSVPRADDLWEMIAGRTYSPRR